MQAVGIVDYGMGNLASIRNAFESIGASVRVMQNPAELREVTHVVLPGVGAFGDGINNLRSSGWDTVLTSEVRDTGRPFLGICLGMQMLATHGTEHGDRAGLGWITGRVTRLADANGTLRVPHVGWNDVRIVRRDGCYRSGFENAGVFYYVHSYRFEPDDAAVVDGWCDYGEDFVASIADGNIWGVQFHPEKSQRAGLQLLRNFLSLS